MVIISWNVQGLGRPLTFQILRGLCITHRPLVVFLMESKNKRETLERFRRKLQFPNGCYVDPNGLSGGLALWWKEEVAVDVRFRSKNLMRCIIKWPAIPSSWLCSFIYAPPIAKDRRDFWDQIRDIHRENSFPWLCMGDFNEIGSVMEKTGGQMCRRDRIEKFLQLLSECELMDLEFKGPRFT